MLEAIANYRRALLLPDCQAYKHTIMAWLQKHVRKYVSYNFNIENYKRKNFEKEPEDDLKERLRKLREKNDNNGN